MMDKKKVIIYGGGTVNYVRNHLSLCAQAYGGTARRLANLCATYLPNLEVDLRLTKMACSGQSDLETNQHIAKDLEDVIESDRTKVVIMSAALCDFEGSIGELPSGKHGRRLDSRMEEHLSMNLTPAKKLISMIRKKRKDIFLVGFKNTCNLNPLEQYIKGINLCKEASCNLVFANDSYTRLNMIITPEEARYAETTNRDEALIELLKMINLRSHLTFTRSTVVSGEPVSWNSDLVPSALKEVVNFCIAKKAYKSVVNYDTSGITAGHFACKIDDTTFLTSIRRTDFNRLNEVGLVKIVTDGPDTVLAYGAKPSVGGQSQRIVFRDHPDTDCIVHFHCPIKADSQVPIVSQKEFECGSHECGKNTSQGLKKFGNLYAVYLDNHGPNIVFNRNIDPKEVINFIETNFDLLQKTGGFLATDIKNQF